MTSIWEDLYISITLQQSDPSKLKQFVAHYNNSVRNKSSHISSCRKSHGTDHHNLAKSEIESGTFDDESRKRESNYSTTRTEDKDSIVYGSSSDKKYDKEMSSSVIKPKNDHDVSALSDDDEKSSNKENDRIMKSKITSSSYEDKKSIKPSLKEKPEPEDNLEKIVEEQKKDEELKENDDVKIEDNKDEKPEEKKDEKKEETVETEEKKEDTNSPPI